MAEGERKGRPPPGASAHLRKAHARQGSLDVRATTLASPAWLPATALHHHHNQQQQQQQLPRRVEKDDHTHEAGDARGAGADNKGTTASPGGGCTSAADPAAELLAEAATVLVAPAHARAEAAVDERTTTVVEAAAVQEEAGGGQPPVAAQTGATLTGSWEWLMPHSARERGAHGPTHEPAGEAGAASRRQWIAASREWSHTFPAAAASRPTSSLASSPGSPPTAALQQGRLRPAREHDDDDDEDWSGSATTTSEEEEEVDSSSDDDDDDDSSDDSSGDDRDDSMSEDTDVDDSEASQLAEVKVTFFSIPTPSSISPTARPLHAPLSSEVLPVGSTPLGSKLQQRKHLRERSLSQLSRSSAAVTSSSHPLLFAKVAISPSSPLLLAHALVLPQPPPSDWAPASPSASPSSGGRPSGAHNLEAAADGDVLPSSLTATPSEPARGKGNATATTAAPTEPPASPGDSKRSSTDMGGWPPEKEFMRACVDRLFAGESLEREDLERMAALFSAKWGRRCFSLALNQARAKEEIALLDGPFCDLCALFEAALIASEESADYRCAKHLTHMSLTFYRLLGSGWSVSEVQDFVQNTLQRSGKVHIWKEELFWEEVYYDSVMEEREKVMREALETPWRAFTSAEQADIIEKEKNFIFGQLGSYSCTMLSFGVPIERASEFIERHCVINSLTADQKQMLLNNLDPLAGSFSQEEKEREVKIRKAVWLRKQKEEWARSREKRLKMRNTPPVRRIHRSTSSIDPSSYALDRASPSASTAVGSAAPLPKQQSARDLSSRSPPDTKESRPAVQKPARRKTRIAELFFKPPLHLFSLSPDKSVRGGSGSGDDGSPLSPRSRGGSPSPSSLSSPPPTSPSSSSSSLDHHSAEQPRLSPRSSSSPSASPRSLESGGGGAADGGTKKGSSRLWPRKDSPRANARLASDLTDPPHPAGDEGTTSTSTSTSSGLSGVVVHSATIAAPRNVDELARLKRHNQRLEELIETYEKHFSLDVLAALAYPSLAFAQVPAPHTKAGWLMKLVGRVKKTWRRRLFLLKDDFLLCYAAQDSSYPDHIFRLHRGTTIRSVELYLTAFKEIRKDLREGTAPGADQKPRDQSSCHPYCLEIATIVHDPRSFGARGPTGKRLMVSADSEESQRDWFYCLKKAAAAAKWYKDTTRDPGFLADKEWTRRPVVVASPT